MTITPADYPENIGDAASQEFGLVWQQFEDRFQSEADCFEELLRILGEQVLRCRRCGSFDLQRNYGERTGQCRCCHKKNWLLADTLFHDIRSARPWLAALWFLTNRVSISSSRFHKLVGIAYSSAFAIFHKLATVIVSGMQEQILALQSEHFDPVICKRSRETPARKHPVSEQEQINSTLINNEAGLGRDAGEANSQASAFESEQTSVERDEGGSAAMTLPNCGNEPSIFDQLPAEQRQVLQVMSDEPAHFDQLCAATPMSASSLAASLTMLELEGLVKCLPGNRYVRSSCGRMSDESLSAPNQETSHYEAAKKTIAAVIDFVRINFHGISRKYLQNYLAAHWYHSSRMCRRPGWLIRECLRSGPLTGEEIMSYVSPPMVKAFLAAG